MKALIEEKTSSNWVIPSKKYYTPDDVLDAYLKGKKAQEEFSEKELLQKFDENIDKAKKIVEQIADELYSNDFDLIKAYLIWSNLFKFEAIFDVEQKDYLSSEFNKMYSNSINKQKEVINDTFYINLSFMPHTGKVDETKLASEGPLMIYQKSE